MNLIERVERTQKTLDEFIGREFVDGKVDCIQVAHHHARRFGKRIKIPRYGDTKSGLKALRSMGFKTLGEAMTANFQRIEPHEVLVGDYVETPGSSGFSSIMVVLGNGRALGFHESIPHCDVLQPVLISGAWRIDG